MTVPVRYLGSAAMPAARVLLITLCASVLAACGGGGGGGGSPPPSSGNPPVTPPPTTPPPPPPPTTPPPPTNAAPTAEAGEAKTANFPEPVAVQGSGADPENAALTYTWSGTGPGTVTFAAATNAATTATFSVPGAYTLTLSVSDGANTATDTTTVTVNNPIFPGAAWETTTPAAAGMKEPLLVEAQTHATSLPRPLPSNPALTDEGGSGVIVRYGKVVYQWGSQERRYDLKSTTKSIGSIALLAALADPTVLTLDTTGVSKLGDAFGKPPANDQALLDAITIRHLATHSAGFEKPDPIGSADDGELVDAPGTTWRYSDAGLNWLADVLTVTFNEDLYTTLNTRVFSKLGISTSAGPAPAIGDLYWRQNALREPTLSGINRREFASGISANVDAMARLGYLFLRNGNWNGEQILAATNVALVSTPDASVASINNPDSADFPNATTNYGLLWWTNKNPPSTGNPLPNVPPDAYWAWGLGDSLIIVIPSLDLVIARAGVPPTNAGPRGGWNNGWNGDYQYLTPFLDKIVQATLP